MQASNIGEGDTRVVTFEDLMTRCSKNNLSKALLYMQRALQAHGEGATTQQTKKMFEVRPHNVLCPLFFLLLPPTSPFSYSPIFCT